MSQRRPQTIGHHLIWTLYGHWLPNDPRGSGSERLEFAKFAPLGPVYHGRKPVSQQPSRNELRTFHQQAEPLLTFERFWLDAATRQAAGEAIGEVVADAGYTVWACAVLTNHAHLVIRRHRDDALTMWHKIADFTRLRLRREFELTVDHPVWAERPYKVFLPTPAAVQRCVGYVEDNPAKEHLSAQSFDFVTPYDNWPFHKRNG